MDLQLEGKTALVTGSTAGIGFAIAHRLLQEGASVFINGRTEHRVKDAVNRLKEMMRHPNVNGIAADFTKVEDIKELVRHIPQVDILVNNLGIFEAKPFTRITDEEWKLFFEVNVLSGVRLSRYYLPIMLDQNWGRIIFISSESGQNIPEEMIHYGMTKTAQLSVARGLAELTRGTNVTVNSIMPGPTRSEGVEAFITGVAMEKKISAKEAEAEFFKTVRPSSIIQRFASVDEIANLVAFVASPLSSATNGAALRADGGVVKSIL